MATIERTFDIPPADGANYPTLPQITPAESAASRHKGAAEGASERNSDVKARALPAVTQQEADDSLDYFGVRGEADRLARTQGERK
jgi:hypothetical protein